MAETIELNEISALEQLRLERVMSIMPRGATTILEIGARHGAMTRRLAEICQDVTALDLKKPAFRIDGVTNVQGDVRRLQFLDNSFECVVCTEVLEHVPDFEAAAKEIARVAKSYVLIGVPYRQDTRAGRMTCVHCGKINPPFGHINTFDEAKIKSLFPGLKVSLLEYLSKNRERTNFLSTWLEDFAGNPYGTYDQEEPCIACGGKLEEPVRLSFVRRVAGALGIRLYHLQYRFNRPRATWMLVLFEKKHFQ
ncbi:MAG: class I SAM-dependent methyltransferase [Acidobacteriaceae bacterium]|nr:class I SAM-dependent methyltransferase [Acidobacteriaceae bacterium]